MPLRQLIATFAAESGTLMLPSAPECPTTLNLLADTEVVLLRAPGVVGATRRRGTGCAANSAACRAMSYW